jgi:Ion channel
MLLPLGVATALLCCSLLSYGVAMHCIVRIGVALIRRGYTELGLWKNIVVMAIVILIMAAAHLIQIALWAVAVLLCENISTWETAFYYSAQNYTALGYGDVRVSEQWRLLGPLEAINGILFFGLSTAVLFAVLSRLIANHLRAETGHQGEPAGNQEPLSAAGHAPLGRAQEYLSEGRRSAAEDAL